MSWLNFETKVILINHRLIVHFPTEISTQLPSRGMVMIEGSINQTDFKVALEPDGLGSHWFEIDPLIAETLKLSNSALVKLKIRVTQQWTEPKTPEDLIRALTEFNLLDDWQSLTVKARWEWVRWIQFTKNPETRNRRIEITCSKLEAGKKRPCCFDLSRCTVTDVSTSGILNISKGTETF